MTTDPVAENETHLAADAPNRPRDPRSREQAEVPARAHGGKQPGSRRPLIILMAIFVVLALAGLFYYLRARDFQVTDDAFIEAHIVQVSTRVAGIVKAVKVEDNQEVKKGDLLIELDSRDFDVALEKARAELSQANAKVLQGEAQVEQAVAQLAQAQGLLTQQRAQFDVAQLNYNRNAGLFQKDLRAVSRQDVDTTKATSDAGRAAFDAARANVEAVQAAGGAAQAQLRAARAAVGASEAAVHDAELQLSYTKILAVADGKIARKLVEPGDYAQPSQTLLSLVEHHVWVIANFKETQLTKMRAGQPVELKLDSYPNEKLKGHVAGIQAGTGARFSLLPPENASGNYVKVVQRVPVKIVFDEPEDILRRLAPGMSVTPRVRINIQPRNGGNQTQVEK